MSARLAVERLRVEAKDSDELLATVADACGDAVRLWRAIESEGSLDEVCLRFRDKRDRCQLEPPADRAIKAERFLRKCAKISSAARDWFSV